MLEAGCCAYYLSKPNDQLNTSDSSSINTAPQSRPFSQRGEQRAVS